MCGFLNGLWVFVFKCKIFTWTLKLTTWSTEYRYKLVRLYAIGSIISGCITAWHGYSHGNRHSNQPQSLLALPSGMRRKSTQTRTPQRQRAVIHKTQDPITPESCYPQVIRILRSRGNTFNTLSVIYMLQIHPFLHWSFPPLCTLDTSYLSHCIHCGVELVSNIPPWVSDISSDGISNSWPRLNFSSYYFF